MCIMCLPVLSLLGTNSGTGVGDLDAKDLGLLEDGNSLLGRHVGSDLSGKGVVVPGRVLEERE